MGTLDGVRIIEFAGIGPAPFCAMVLSDLGADVIRLHRTSAVDIVPGVDALVDRTEGIMARGRRSIAVDLKNSDGVAVVRELLAGADGLIEGFRPGVMERLGLGPADCLAANPRLVYGRMTGWGQDGPYAQAAGHDVNYLAIAGVLAHIGKRGEPPVVPLNIVGDFGGGGLLLALGMVAGLFEAQRSGLGQTVDAAMVDGSSLLMAMMFELLGRDMWVEERESNMNDGGAPFYAVYETADHKYVAIAAMEPKFYAILLERLGLSEADLPGLQWDETRWPATKQYFAEVFRRKTRDEWCDLLEDTDACFAPVLTMREAPHHPHLVARRSFVDVDGIRQPAPAPRFSRTPSTVQRPAARPGEHTAEVLREAGLSSERVEHLISTRAVAEASEKVNAAPSQ
ncbi:MAG: alpha-methylacyl-CoA racemase [Frankiales bacterium]|jgi:alpha-methylacyl-CoA racemase|nr:alpha-methylacyl-CoA racemase [Frankiales bacterium]